VRAFILLILVLLAPLAEAQTLTSANVQIEWKVANRFRLFQDEALFKQHESAWQQYQLHINDLNIGDDQKQRLQINSAVLGTEHVLNDRHIAFTRILRNKYDWRGWAAKAEGRLCWDAKSRQHKACGGVENYVNPSGHGIEISLRALERNLPLQELNCEWRVGDEQPLTAPCDATIPANLPYPGGAAISVNVVGEQPISITATVKDLLIVGLGDSFASGEGNPDLPVAFQSAQRIRNLYPKRAQNDSGGSATWTDKLCHRSLYGHQLRAALQIAIENPKAAVTFLGYSCSGATVEEGILGPQAYVEYVTTRPNASSDNDKKVAARAISGDSKDSQLYWLLRELCQVKPQKSDGLWACPNQQFRRTVDYVLLSIGGNDIGFSNLVGWATLRDGTASSLAKYFGATVSANQFARNMRDILPGAYAKLAKAISATIPIDANGQGYDAGRVILTAYPDILADENGDVCPAPAAEGEDEDLYAANQSLDFFNAWLAVTSGRLTSAKNQLEKLHNRMGELAEDHGWSFAGRAYADKPFRGHGFCARKNDLAFDPPEVLMMPCVGNSDRDTKTCETSWSGKVKGWRPYNPETQNYPYALRQRWVRTFNDAYLVMNQKVVDRSGRIDEETSAAIFSETTGAMHPSAEGHAAMADAILMDLRSQISEGLAQ
jgi:lysophospholipase L1-like esterase